VDQLINFVDRAWWIFLIWCGFFGGLLVWVIARVRSKDRVKYMKPHVARMRVVFFSTGLGISLLLLAFSAFINALDSL